MSELTVKEMEIVVNMLENYSDYLGSRGCNDFEWPCNWSDEEKTKFTKEFHDFNGDPEEYEEGDILNADFCVVGFLAFKLEQGVKN